MGMKAPKEDPSVKAARLRERQMAEREMAQTGQEDAASMTDTFRRAYGPRFSLLGMRR